MCQVAERDRKLRYETFETGNKVGKKAERKAERVIREDLV